MTRHRYAPDGGRGNNDEANREERNEVNLLRCPDFEGDE
jgi:hypothetical protein